MCGAYYNNTDDEFCPKCVAIKLETFWEAKNWHVSMHSDGNQFIAEINAGIEGETYLSVGYSSPNYAWITKEMIPTLQVALDEYYEKIIEKNLDDMLIDLLELCKVANTVYNKLLWKQDIQVVKG
jgi:hypothetical protein